MKKAIFIFGVLFTAVSFVSCSSDDFENQTNVSNKNFTNEVKVSSYARLNDTIANENSDNQSDAQQTDGPVIPIVIIKKD